MSDSTSELDRVLARLDQLAEAGEVEPADAIDRVRQSPRRSTQTQSIRSSAAMKSFRQEMTDGLIRADTANQVLKLISEILSRFV